MANEYLVNSADMTAVADAIRAKGGTSEAMAFPVGFVNAIGAIQAGSGGGVTLPYEGKPGQLGYYNLFEALANEAVVAGEFTLAAPIAAGSNLIFDSGLSFVRGFLLFNESWDLSVDDPASGSITAFAIFADGIQDQPAFSMGTGYNQNYYSISGGHNTWPFDRISAASIDGGALYMAPQFGGNWGYTPLRPNYKYVWLAWGDK